MHNIEKLLTIWRCEHQQIIKVYLANFQYCTWNGSEKIKTKKVYLINASLLNIFSIKSKIELRNPAWSCLLFKCLLKTIGKENSIAKGWLNFLISIHNKIYPLISSLGSFNKSPTTALIFIASWMELNYSWSVYQFLVKYTVFKHIWHQLNL